MSFILVAVVVLVIYLINIMSDQMIKNLCSMSMRNITSMDNIAFTSKIN